jgi:hypothetical protein
MSNIKQSDSFLNQYNYYFDLIKLNPSLLQHIPIDYQEDANIIETALKQDWTVYFQLLPQKQNNPDYCFICFSNYITIKNPTKYSFIPKSLRTNNDFLERCITLIDNPYTLLSFFKYLFKTFNGNIPENIIISGVKKEGTIIQYANKQIQDNFDICMIAVKNNSFSLSYLSNNLKNTLIIIEKAILGCPDFYQTIWNQAGETVKELSNSQDCYTFFSKLKLSENLNKKLKINSQQQKKSKI